jgi:integrase
MPRRVSKPAYFRHKPSGQARVRIDGKDHYLGLIDSDDSWTRYDALIEDWVRRKPIDRSTLTIDELCLRFLADAKKYYVKGSPKPEATAAPQVTSEVACIRAALRPLIRKSGTELAAGFGPLKLKAVRESMIRAGIARPTINKYVQRIRRVFRWGVENELVPATAHHALAAVRGLAKRRCEAPEPKPIKAVALERVEAIRPHVSRHVWGMVQLQLLTGARPGEIVSMRVGDLNTTGPVWEYAPREHKTEHHDKSRVISIGPRGQQLLREFLTDALASDQGADAFVFSPSDAEAERSRRRRHDRKSPMTPSQATRRAKPDGRRRPRDHYTVASYRRAIARGCELAFEMPRELRTIPKTAGEKQRLRLAAAKWREANCWRPNQLRHSAGTFLRREFGIEAASVILGHADLKTTEIYAEADLQRAREIMGTVG